MSQEDSKPHQAHPSPRPEREGTGTQGLRVVTIAPGSDLNRNLAASEAGAAPSEAVKAPSTSNSTAGVSLASAAPALEVQAQAGEHFDTRPPPPPAPDPYIGCTIDNRYKVERLLGEGGMGMVYKCRHKMIDKIVAMKILRSDLARDKEVTERFLIEARAASSIGSEHIIDISDFGQLPDGSAYFVMEFLEGAPLSASVNEHSPMPVPRILNVSLQLATGLAAAHAAGIVHRDLKPDNIYLVKRGSEPDFVKILDFGIAKVTSGATGKLTQAGSVFGTPHYMSPEQAAGAPVDHRGDVYSFGVILYELACGRVPFDADNFMGILTQHMYKAPVPIRALLPETNADVSPGLEAIILKCLSKRPEHRYQTMGELSADLQRVLEDEVPEAVPEMMERSGGFNVPADFFKKDGPMSGPVAATPEPVRVRRTNWPLYAGIAAPMLIAGGIFFAQSTTSPAQIGGDSTDAPAPAAGDLNVLPEPGTKTAVKAEPTVAPLATVKQVLVAIDPIEAHAFVADEDLGQAPVMLEVPEGKTLKMQVRHKGYKSQTIEIDGSEPKLVVKLDPVKRPKKRWTPPANKGAPPPPKRVKRPTLGGGEIVNPWD